MSWSWRRDEEGRRFGDASDVCHQHRGRRCRPRVGALSSGSRSLIRWLRSPRLDCSDLTLLTTLDTGAPCGSWSAGRCIVDGAGPTPPTDANDTHPRSGTALCLSRGGYRATLFHCGTLSPLSGRLSYRASIASRRLGHVRRACNGLEHTRVRGSCCRTNCVELVTDEIRGVAGEPERSTRFPNTSGGCGAEGC
jgi:hypothetical protein